MMSSQKSPWAICIATCCVAIGAGIFYFVSPKIQTDSVVVEGGVSEVVEVSAQTTSSLSLVLVNKETATILSLNGKEERITLDQLDARFGKQKKPREGASAANGGYVQYPVSGVAPGAIVSPDGAYSAHLADPRADGATAIVLKPLSGIERLIVLRKGNEPLRDGAFAGWFDSQTMAIVAYTDTEKNVYAAGLDGSVRTLAALPDTVVLSSMRARSFWYMTAVQGAGIEVPPKGPSELHRVSIDGKDVRMARDEKRVIFGLIADEQGRIVYSMDDGSSVFAGLNVPQGQIELGKRRALGILPDGRLILREGFSLSLFDPITGSTERIGELPEGDVSVFITSAQLDARQP